MRDPILRDNIHVEENMKLPEGKACGDCSSFNRCASLFGQISSDQVCDFSPNRFQEKQEAAYGQTLASVATT